ncbi:MAG TPA: hypothetical protein VHO50_03170 [Bacteroidales bacterium]|nr:hypothetical protein [Bacteroidales bacterium]
MFFDWKIKKGKIQQRFSSVKASDLKHKLGKENEIIRRLRERLGKTDEEILDLIIHI